MTEAGVEAGVTPQIFSSVYPRLYHLAHEDVWPQIQRYGLLSTKSILDLWEVESSLRRCITTEIRPSAVELWHPRHGKAVIRDQKPLKENKLRAALIDCTPEEWCQLLNGKVFFWPSKERLHTHLAARENRGKRHLVLTIDSRRFTVAYEQRITLCAMNSGNTIPFAQKRGKSSLMKMSDYPFEARRKRGTYSTVAELAVDTDIPDVLDFVVSVAYMTSDGEVQKICGDAAPDGFATRIACGAAQF